MARENNPENIDTLAKRLGMLLFSGLFAAAFGLGGYFAGLQPLAQTLRAALEVRSWHPVAAQVLGTELKRHTSSDGTTYRVHARYRYEFAGRQYEGTRVGLDPEAGADNIGDWHQHWHGLLQSAQSRGQPITIMVNPQAPSQALIDPSIRWALQMFRVPFALVFTGVGLVAGWFFLHILLGGAAGSRRPSWALRPSRCKRARLASRRAPPGSSPSSGAASPSPWPPCCGPAAARPGSPRPSFRSSLWWGWC